MDVESIVVRAPTVAFDWTEHINLKENPCTRHNPGAEITLDDSGLGVSSASKGDSLLKEQSPRIADVGHSLKAQTLRLV